MQLVVAGGNCGNIELIHEIGGEVRRCSGCAGGLDDGFLRPVNHCEPMVSRVKLFDNFPQDS